MPTLHTCDYAHPGISPAKMMCDKMFVFDHSAAQPQNGCHHQEGGEEAASNYFKVGAYQCQGRILPNYCIFRITT
jgi:hypothetical protein